MNKPQKMLLLAEQGIIVIELMIAISLLTIILLALYRFTQQQRIQVSYQQQYLQALRQADQQLTRLIEQQPFAVSEKMSGSWRYHWQSVTPQCQQLTVQWQSQRHSSVSVWRWRCQPPVLG